MIVLEEWVFKQIYFRLTNKFNVDKKQLFAALSIKFTFINIFSNFIFCGFIKEKKNLLIKIIDRLIFSPYNK